MEKNIHSSLWFSFNIILILKPGFYELVVRSKLETAKMFRLMGIIFNNILIFKSILYSSYPAFCIYESYLNIFHIFQLTL